MKLKNNIFTTLLLSIGLIMHQIVPGVLGGMKFDFLIIFMVTSILINPRFKNSILTGLLGGILSAMTTSFPGGQLPNIIDKLITSLAVYMILKILQREDFTSVLLGLIGGIGTLISGSTFVISAAFIVGLPVPLEVLIKGIVIPTALVNTVGTIFIYRLVKLAMKRSKVII